MTALSFDQFSNNRSPLRSPNVDSMPGKHDMEAKPLLGSSLSKQKWYRSKFFYLDLLRRCLGEFFGTTLFVFLGVSSTRDTETDPTHNYDITPSSVTTVALGHGLAIMAMVASFGHIR